MQLQSSSEFHVHSTKNQISKDKLLKNMFTPCSLIIGNDYLTNKKTVAVKNARIYSQMQNSLIALYFSWESKKQLIQ